MVEKHDVVRAKIELMLWELIDFCAAHPEETKSTDHRVWSRLMDFAVKPEKVA